MCILAVLVAFADGLSPRTYVFPKCPPVEPLLVCNVVYDASRSHQFARCLNLKYRVVYDGPVQTVGPQS